MCNVSWSLKDNIEQTFNLCQVVPAVLKQHIKQDFSSAMLSGASRTTLHRVSLVLCCSGSIKTTYTGFPSVQCCLEPQG